MMRTRAGARLLLEMVGDDGVFDAGVEAGGDNALLVEVGFGAVGTEADDSIGPDAGDAGNPHQLFERGTVDVDEPVWRRGL